MLFEYIGIGSALLFVAGDIPYVLDTYRRKTKPHRVTWGIVALLNAIGFANQYAYGATNSLWLFGAGVIMTAIIFIGSLRNGTGGRTKTDIVCLVIALLGVSFWVFFKIPLYSIFANILADIAALWPTYIKARKYPESETRIAWLVGTISVLLDAVSVGRLDLSLILLPAASAIMQGYMVYLLYFPVNTKPKRVIRPAETPALS
jgi:hypothetical protein